MSLDGMEPPSKEVLEKVRSEFGLNEERVKEAVELLKDWIQLQPHLPKEIDDGRLERWLIRCKNSTEKVKMTLDMYYSLKSSVPDLMTGWDTEGDWFRMATKNHFVMPMPKLTAQNDRVIIYGILNPDEKEYNFLQHIKLVQMVQEIRISEDYCRSDIIISDLNNYSLAHILKVSVPYVKKYEVCVLSGYNFRVKELHFLNAKPWIDKVFALLKLGLKTKLLQRIQVHGSDFTSLHEQVPKEILPTEYGGEAGSIAENWGRWKKKLESYHDIFLEREKHKSDESKRPGHSVNSSDLLGFEGSFRKLDVD